MKKIEFKSTNCALCGSSLSKDFEVVFPANYLQTDVTRLFSARRLPDGIHYRIVRCLNDGQLRSNPVLSEEMLNYLYKDSEFNYQHEVPNLVDTYLRALEPILSSLKKTDKILEIGCGSGFVLSALHHKGFTNVFGVEPSKDAIAEADKSIKKNITGEPFSSALFPKRSFKCIFFLQTLDHIPNPNQFLKDCYELLAPGGFILSYHHNVESWSAKILQEKSPIFDIEHTYLYSHRTTRKIFKKAGFKIKQIYAPTNTLSLFHLLWLIPIPKKIKKSVLKNEEFKKITELVKVQLPLGNTCVIAQKSQS